MFFLVVATGLSPFFRWRNRAGTRAASLWVTIWLCWVNLIIHGSALHAAGPTLFEADTIHALEVTGGLHHRRTLYRNQGYRVCRCMPGGPCSDNVVIVCHHEVQFHLPFHLRTENTWLSREDCEDDTPSFSDLLDGIR